MGKSTVDIKSNKVNDKLFNKQTKMPVVFVGQECKKEVVENKAQNVTKGKQVHGVRWPQLLRLGMRMEMKEISVKDVEKQYSKLIFQYYIPKFFPL